MNDEQEFIEDNLIIISRQTFNAFKKQKDPSDLVGLYTFYYDCAKYQKTNQPWATTGFVQKGLNWGRKRVIKNKKILMDLGLIEDIKLVDRKTKKVIKWFIKIRYIWKKESVKNVIKTTVSKSHRVDEPQGGKVTGWTEPFNHNEKEPKSDAKTTVSYFHPVESRYTNASRGVVLNALSDIVDFIPNGINPHSPSGDPIWSPSSAKGGALENAEGSKGTSLDSLHGNLLLSKKLSSNVTGSSKKTEKETEAKYIKNLAEKYFVPEEKRTEPECRFDYEKYYDALTEPKYEGRSRRGIVIGNYFTFKKMKFMSAKAAYLEFKRNLKPATVIVEYKLEDIQAAFEYLDESKFGKSFSWTLETVAKYVVMPEIVDGTWRHREKKGEYC